MKIIYINTNTERVFYSAKELREDLEFQRRFSNYLANIGVSKSLISSNFYSLVTQENLQKFFNEYCNTNWKMFTTEKNVVYIGWWDEVITDDLDYFISQLDPDDLYGSVIDNYRSIDELYKDIKSKNETCSEFLWRTILKDESIYQKIDLTEISNKKEIYIDYTQQEYYTSYEELRRKTGSKADKDHTQDFWKNDPDKEVFITNNDVIYIDWINEKTYDNIFELLTRRWEQTHMSVADLKYLVDIATSAKGDYTKIISSLYSSDIVTVAYINE